MARIPPVTDDDADRLPDAALVAAIRQRRGGTLLNLDRQLLRSPAFAAGWNALLGAVRTRLSLDPKLREIAMCVVAVLNGADYEFIHHAPELLKAGGTQAQVDAIGAMRDGVVDPAPFDPVSRATIDLSFAMTRDVAVDDATFAAVRAHLDDAATVELVGTIAAYNMVSRFLVALAVEPE